MTIQSDAKIVVAGYSDNLGEYNFALARYYPNGSLDATFDYDGKVVTAHDALSAVLVASGLHAVEILDLRNIFEVIREGDLFVHHPYESFAASVERGVCTPERALIASCR